MLTFGTDPTAYFDICDAAGVDTFHPRQQGAVMRHPHRSYAVMVRSEFFREQVCRFRRCQYRRPSIAEMRALWRQPGRVVVA